MKEKKSNLKDNELTIEEEQRNSIIRLVGLFFIVYGVLSLTSIDLGCAICVPFTFLFGSFAPVALVLLVFAGLYMLLFKKLLYFKKPIKYVLLTLAIIFALVLATNTEANKEMLFADCFRKYLDIYKWNLRFIVSGEEQSVMVLGGGMVGYMFYGLINSMTSGNYQITMVISYIIFIGVIFIFIAPTLTKFLKWFIRLCKKMSARRKEKKALKEEKRRQKELKKEQDLEKANNEFDFNNKVEEDDLLETTEINITGQNYEYVRGASNTDKKLESQLSVFDDVLYPNYIKHQTSSKNDEITNKIIFEDKFALDFEDEKTNKENENIKPLDNFNIKEEEEVKFVDESIKLTDFNNKETLNQVQMATLQEKQQIKEENTLPTNNYVEIKPAIKPTNYVELNKKVEEKPKEEVNVPPAIDFNLIDYELPPLYLLKEAVDNGINNQNEEVAKEKAEILMEKMRELNVSASINAFVVGPSVTRFEIALAPGVRVGSFTNLQEDFKLALGVNSIRIESPIPGKSAIGIEVPNKYRAMVSMKEIITQMPNKKHKLYVPVGKDITGTPLSMAICDMPHCLISGATNSGKSVCANTIILSLLMNYKPSEVRMIMVDPKRVEMLFYKDIPHLLCPIITEAEKARVALDKLCIEMDKRFTTFSLVGVKNIASYNEMMVEQGKFKMPFIILIVDEFAELMLSKNQKMVEERIQKIAQLGRAAGIHLILATQRPDVNVIPGTIKTNLPCRMTFRLSSLADSRTVIDVGGAEKLLNNGDMLLLTPDFTGLRRVQGVYVSDKEISDVVEYCKKQADPQYDPNFLDLRTEEQKADDEKLKYALEGKNNDDEDDSNDEALYEEIKNFVIKERKASTSYLKRKFNIGYFKAANMIDRLEEEGIIGPENGSKPREVLVGNDEDVDEDITDEENEDLDE